MLLNIGAVYLDRGRYEHQEGPIRQNNFLLVLPAEISVCVYQVEKELKMAGNNNKHALLGPSAHFS